MDILTSVHIGIALANVHAPFLSKAPYVLRSRRAGDVTEAASCVSQTPRTYWLITSERKPSCSISKHGKARGTTCRQAWFQWAMLPDHRWALDKLEEAHNQFVEPSGRLLAREAYYHGFS